jgi:sec-independent protein translocase protein TatA
MTFGIQPIHIVIVIVVALLIFGPKRLPEMGRSVGKAINAFREGTREVTDNLRQEVNGAGAASAANNPAMINPVPANPGAAVPAQAPMMAAAPAGNFCTQCGAANTAEARFCNQCGGKLPEKTINPSGSSPIGEQS